MDPIPDDQERRCPLLGGPVTFGYCLTCGADRQPCWKIVDCWWERCDVVARLRTLLAPQALEALLQARPKPKITSILEFIEQARRRCGEKD